MIKKYGEFINESLEEDIASICKEYYIENWTLNSDGSIDVDGNVNLSYKRLTKLPLKFGKVSGHFNCSKNKLTTLEGCPISVGGDFYCHYNQLTTLEGGPNSVGGYFFCSSNKLTTFKGCPESISGYLNYQHNNIVNFYGFPDRLIGIDLYLDDNPLGEIYHGIFKGDSRCIDLLNMTRSIYKNEVREMGIEDIAYTMNFELDDNWRDKIKSYKIVD